MKYVFIALAAVVIYSVAYFDEYYDKFLYKVHDGLVKGLRSGWDCGHRGISLFECEVAFRAYLNKRHPNILVECK